MLAALALGALSGAGSLISGLGARSSAKSQAKHQAAIDAENMKRDAVFMQMMAQDADTIYQPYMQDRGTYGARVDEYSRNMASIPSRVAGDAYAAGFNPATWLNAGALGMYQNWFGNELQARGNELDASYNQASLRAEMMKDKFAVGTQHDLSDAIKVPSVGEAVGAGISSFASAFGTQYRADEKLASEQSMLNQQLAAIALRSASRPGAERGGLAALSGTGGPLYAAGSVSSSRGVGGLSSKAPGDFKVSSTQVFPWLPTDKSAPDSQKVSDRYGEWGEDIAGGYNFASDMSQKFLGKTIPRFVKEDIVGGGADMADFFSMDTARNRKFFADYFQPTSGPRVEWNNPFVNPYKSAPDMALPTYSTGGGF